MFSDVGTLMLGSTVIHFISPNQNYFLIKKEKGNVNESVQPLSLFF